MIRDHILRGVRPIDGLLFDGPSAAADAVAAWEPGAALLQLDATSLVLKLSQPRVMRCELGSAVPLTSVAGRLVGWPGGIETPPDAPLGAVIRLVHGATVTQAPGPAVDPTSLLDLSGWQVEQPTGAGQPDRTIEADTAPPAPPSPPQLIVTSKGFNGREKLAHRPPTTPRDRRAWRRLQAPKRSSTSPAGSKRQAASTHFAWLQKHRHKKYLDQLTRLFAAGDLEEALRYAIPFGDQTEMAAAGRLRRRSDLRIDLYRPQPSGATKVDPGLQAELQHRYRAAFQQLEREGRILDAAFVLADLLDRPDEAASFLERHGEIRLAAELAEARSQDHAEMVRLWWRAGDRHHAVAVARRFGCFAPAISRLERSGRQTEADGLRQTWMATLLDAGDIVSAYDVGATVGGDAAATLRERLIQLGVDQGGPLRVRMLARQLRAGQDRPHSAFEPLLSGDTTSGERLLLAAELAKVRTEVDHPEVVKRLARRLLAHDRLEAGDHPLTQRTMEKIVGLADDAVLIADLPRLSQLNKPKRGAFEAVWVDIDHSDHGTVAANDVRLLPDGRLAVAVDGLGVRIVKSTGQTQAEFDVHADSLVLSDNGLRVLALRRLGPDALRVTAIAVPERRVRVLGEFPATVWSDTFDGANWFLAHHNQLWLLDMLAEGPTALWHQDRYPEPILAIAQNGTMLAVASRSQATKEPGLSVIVRRYGLPAVNQIDEHRSEVLGPFSLLPDGRLLAADAVDASFYARVESRDDQAVTIAAAKLGEAAPIAAIRLNGASRVTLRIDNHSIVVCDDRGRIEIVDLQTTRMRSFRVTL